MTKKKILIIIDMQYDFISGSLGSEYAEREVLPAVERRIKEKNYDYLIFTQDTHYENYAETLEGEKLPVPHCIYGTHGWEIHSSLISDLSLNYCIIRKNTFGSIKELPEKIRSFASVNANDINDYEIEITGLCTDICVVSNALILRAAFPNLTISVNSSCTGGTSKKAHDAALLTMQSCQIDVV